MTGPSFRAKYDAAVERNRSLLCVGLDPDPARLPPGVTTLDFLRGVIEATADFVCCYKPNASFFEPDGAAGWQTLHDVIALIPDDVPVLLDAKRNDIANSAAGYARACFETLGADGVTVNPYMGGDSLEPFFTYADHHSFVLCRTSNAGAAEVQDALMADGRPLYEHIARLANGWNTRGNVGLVVGATVPEQAARVRALCPDQLLLLPGVGAQEGDLEAAVRASLDVHGRGVLINASRSVIYAGDGTPAAARAEALRLRDAINVARSARAV
jgi:orotidine-5'-phosphate decarboxylase